VTATKRYLLRTLDMVCILVALAFSSWLMLPPYLDIFADYTGASTFTLVTFFLSFYMLDCYSVGREELRDSLIRVVVAVVIGIIGAGFIFYTFEHWRFPRLMFVVQMLVTLALTLGWRLIYFPLSHKWVPKGERVVFLGAAMAERARKVLNEHGPSVEVLGYAGEAGADADKAGPCLGEAASILDVVVRHNASRVVILDTFYLDSDLARRLFDAKLHGLKVDDMRSLYERLARRLPVDLIEDEWLLLENGFNMNANNSMVRLKRAMDVILSLLLLTLTLPVVLVTALLVRLESKGAVLYSQRRVGLGGKEFTVYKIRSMRQDAESGKAVWAEKNDPRVTRVGKFIRKTRIDELPQLVNVLRGEMSLIGPRPERRDFVEELEQKLPYYTVRHTVKPGITGWAQVCYPYGASLEDSRYKLEYDLFYIKNISPLLELKILLRTIGVVLFPTGAR
jgi:sugar transferase, PEP-CTERM system associated/exopolysaccharide biosynthesis polyprenyl glycosylphosphotransferase